MIQLDGAHARVAVQEPFSPLVVLQIEWASLCPDSPVAVGDLLVGVLTVSSFTDHQMVKCNRFGSFFAALFVYLELGRLMGQAWKIHEVMERAHHTRWVSTRSERTLGDCGGLLR